MRLIPELNNAFQNLGINATMVQINLSHPIDEQWKKKENTSGSVCRDVILSHCNILLGSEDEPANRDALHALETWERENENAFIIDPLHTQRLMANRRRFAKPLSSIVQLRRPS